MDPNVAATVFVTIVTALVSSLSIHWRLKRLERLVEAQALERVENHVRVSKLEDRVSALEQVA